MGKGKSQFCTWYCSNCGTANDVTCYDKRRDDEIVKVLQKFCPDKRCRTHQEHKRKDTKKGSNN